MTKSQLQQRSEAFIRDSLRKHLPMGAKVYLFGSRARQTASWHADYDLWIDAEVPERTIGDILDEVAESFVPFKVDLITTSRWATTMSSFSPRRHRPSTDLSPFR